MSDPPKIVITQKTLVEVRAELGDDFVLPSNVTVVADAAAQAKHAAINADDESEAILVCCRTGTASPFADNARGHCNICDAPIFFRPHAPKIKRVCMECAEALVKDESE